MAFLANSKSKGPEARKKSDVVGREKTSGAGLAQTGSGTRQVPRGRQGLVGSGRKFVVYGMDS